MAILLEIPEKKIKKYIAENLSECSSTEYIDICRYLYLYNSQQISFEEFISLSTFSLLGIDGDKNKCYSDSFWQNFTLISEVLFDFENSNGFFYKQAENQLQINQNYTSNPLPYFRIGLRKYIGPNLNMTNIKFGQYTDALNLLYEYSKFKEKNSLVEMTAILYNQKSLFSKKYSKEKSLKKIDKFKFLDPGILYSSFLFLTAFQIQLNQTTIIYGGEEIDMGVIFQSLDDFQSDIPGIGFKEIEYTISETGIYGNIDEVRNTDLWEIFLKLYSSKKKNLDEKKMMEKQNPK